MDKLKMQSRDVVGGNVEKIAALFPQCVTERLNKDGKPELAIDFDKLRAELSDEALYDGEERYQFTWPDKRAASRLANEPTNMTLRPCREESVGKDGTPGGFDSENLYIEGDNLDVLKVLRETYLGRVKMIYIDPPYNTGNDFVYNDDFAQGKDGFEQTNGAFDAEGNQMHDDPMQRNTEANGRFHTDWLNMIYPRLKVARDLLTENGVIFISIDDSELQNLLKVCDEIFGQQNFIASCVRKRRDSQANLSKNISPIHEYIVIYSKNGGDVLNKVPAKIDESEYSNKDNDPRGPYKTMPCTNKGGAVYSVTTPTGKVITEEWRFKKDTYDKLLEEDRLVFPRGGDGKPRYKLFLSEKLESGVLANTWLDDIASNQEATREIKELFGNLTFDTPKPTGLLQFCISLAANSDSIILDFFSGSSTTAHAVMKLNAEDGGKRKFIMVQLPEVTDEKSEARKAGYETICQIGEERIRRAGKKLKEELYIKANNKELHALTLFAVGKKEVEKDRHLWSDINDDIAKEEINNEASEIRKRADNLDTGFRVLKLDSSNMEDVFYTPDKFEPSLLDSLVDNIKADRSGEDLLFQVMLNLGIELSKKIEHKEIAGKEVFSVDNDYLLACFDKDVNETTIEEMAKLHPVHLVIRDASAANDNVLDNFDQIIESYSNEKKITTHIL